MPKRKDPSPTADTDGDVSMGAHNSSPDDGDDNHSSTSSVSHVNVDFEMFDPQPAHDFHSLRQLLRQLFDTDSPLFDLSALTDLILSQPLLGTTVKTDGNESDAYAFLTVLNLHQHAANPAIRALTEYLLGKNPSLQPVLDSGDGKNQCGLILTERLINMPVEIVPPMYKMLVEEIEWAVQDGEPYAFTHFLVLSKTYTEVPSKLDELENRPLKKWKKKRNKGAKAGELFYYHPEDEVMVQRLGGLGKGRAMTYIFDKEGESADSKRAFSDAGVKPQGLMMLLEKDELTGIVRTLEGLFKP